MCKRISKLPSSAQYIYCTQDIDGSVSKIYRAKSKKRLYLVNRDIVLSYTLDDLRQLSNKILDAYDEIKKSDTFE